MQKINVIINKYKNGKKYKEIKICIVIFYLRNQLFRPTSCPMLLQTMTIVVIMTCSGGSRRGSRSWSRNSWKPASWTGPLYQQFWVYISFISLCLSLNLRYPIVTIRCGNRRSDNMLAPPPPSLLLLKLVWLLHDDDDDEDSATTTTLRSVTIGTKMNAPKRNEQIPFLIFFPQESSLFSFSSLLYDVLFLVLQVCLLSLLVCAYGYFIAFCFLHSIYYYLQNHLLQFTSCRLVFSFLL